MRTIPGNPKRGSWFALVVVLGVLGRRQGGFGAAQNGSVACPGGR
jgi:hypothetical protein